MSALIDRALDDAGLSAIADRRASGVAEPAVAADDARLRDADLLALGALADRVRRQEVGDEVYIHAPPTADASPGAVVLPGDGAPLTGLELLREVAVARITGPRGVRVRVDWTRCGLEIAQVALGFGANELGGVLLNKAGQPLGSSEKLGVGKKSRLQLASTVKRDELAGLVRRAGRVPVFVGAAAGEPEPSVARAVACEEVP